MLWRKAPRPTSLTTSFAPAAWDELGNHTLAKYILATDPDIIACIPYL